MGIDQELEASIEERNLIVRMLTIGQTAMDLFSVETLPFMMIVFDLRRMSFVSVSDSCRNILGYEPKELEGKSFIPFVIGSESIKQSIEKVDQNLLKNIAATDYTNHYRHKDGIHAVPITWWAGGNQNGVCFCIGIPGPKQIIENHG